MVPPRRVLIYTDLEHTARRQIVQGVGRFARECPRWQPLIPWADLDVWSLPEDFQADGVIAFPNTRDRIDFLHGLPCPVVCVGPHFSEAKLPRVDWDDELAGRLALEHIVALGLQRVAFVGGNFGLGYVDKRLHGARDAAARHRIHVEALELEPGGHRAGKLPAAAQSTMRWLANIEPPFGVISATDNIGFDLLNALRSADIAVPEQAAVISIGGDNALCPFSDPALSSVELPGEQVGYEAARLLDQWINGQKPPRQVLIPPKRVITRRSSDIVVTNDEMVRRALVFIRQHATESIGVCNVLNAVPLSRRPLELRFKRDTGRTIQKEILRVRLERAKHMLVETDLSISEIAIRCGFSEPQRMTEVFSRELGTAPGAFRQSHRRIDSGKAAN